MKISVGNIGVVPSPSQQAALFGAEEEETFVLSLTLNALAYGQYSKLARKKNSDGRYCTIEFPDDFVHTAGDSGTISVTDQGGGATIPKDPFYGYRDTNNIVNTALNVTIEIPQGMDVSANTFGRYVNWVDVNKARTAVTTHLGYSPYASVGGYDLSTATSALVSSADPCIMVDFDTCKVTQDVISGPTTVKIKNSGNTVGAGGFGGYGGKVGNSQGDNGSGGGAGRGHHQDRRSEAGTGLEFDSARNTSYYLYGLVTARDTWITTVGDDSSRYLTPGVGGLACQYAPGITKGSGSGNLANGGFSNSTITGAGGAGVNIVLTGTNFASYDGGWGGYVVYFRSNTEISTSGTKIEIENTSTGIMKGGGGGGAGTEAKRNDLSRDGGDGGGLATDGEHTITAGQSSPGGGGAYGGLAGSVLFWNTANVTPSNTITNYNTSHSIKGRDGEWTA
jgi:hypothetical protein